MDGSPAALKQAYGRVDSNWGGYIKCINLQPGLGGMLTSPQMIASLLFAWGPKSKAWEFLYALPEFLRQ